MVRKLFAAFAVLVAVTLTVPTIAEAGKRHRRSQGYDSQACIRALAPIQTNWGRIVVSGQFGTCQQRYRGYASRRGYPYPQQYPPGYGAYPDVYQPYPQPGPWYGGQPGVYPYPPYPQPYPTYGGAPPWGRPQYQPYPRQGYNRPVIVKVVVVHPGRFRQQVKHYRKTNGRNPWWAQSGYQQCNCPWIQQSRRQMQQYPPQYPGGWQPYPPPWHQRGDDDDDD